MISFSSLTKRRGATLAGVFSVALSGVLLLCGAGSVPVENLLPQGAMQGDLNAGGHNLTNAATVSATTVNATNVAVSGSLTLPAGFTQSATAITGLTSAATNSAAYLQPGNNLSDVSNAATARTNLGLGSAATNSASSLTGSPNNSAGGAVTVDTSGASASTISGDANNNPNAVNIIIDTDCGNDPGDVEAIATALALQQRGECNLLGVVTDVYGNVPPSAVSATLNWAGYGKIPVGTFLSATTPAPSNASAVTTIAALPNSIPASAGTTYGTDSVALVRKILAKQKNNSVKIVGIGGASMLYYLYNSSANYNGDGILLTGAQLMLAKLNATEGIVQMGGAYPSSTADGPSGNPEYNFALDPASDAVYAALNSTGIHVTFLGFQIFSTLPSLYSALANPASPVYLATTTTTDTWDQDAVLYAVLYAVRGLSYGGTNYWTATPGANTINTATGANTWNGSGSGQQYLSFASGGSANIGAATVSVMQQSPAAGAGVSSACPSINIPNGTLTVASTSTAPASILNVKVVSTNAYNPTADLTDSALTTGQYVYQGLGEGDSTKNEGSWAFNYAGNGSNANSMSWGFFNTAYFMTLFANGDFSVGSTTDPGVPFGVTGAAVITGNVTTGGEVIYSNSASCVTGSGSAALGANCPATTTTAPYKWLKLQASDGSTVYVPAWK